MKKRLLVILTLVIGISLPLRSQLRELSLSGAIAYALENNYGIQVAEQNLDIAEIQNSWGRAGRYPSVGFDVAFNNSYDISGEELSSGFVPGIGVDWMLFDGFRVKITKSILENTEDLVSGNLSVVIENTIESVILAYYAVLLEEEKLKVLKTVMELSSDRYEYERRRKELGASVTYEVLQAENVFLADKAAFLEQEMRVRIVRRNLNYLLAIEPATSWALTESFQSDTTRYTLSALQEKLLSSNQTLKNQYINLMVKKEEIKLKQSDYYPSLSTSAGMNYNYQRSISQGGDPEVFDSYNPYANLRLSFDLYQGGIRKQAVKIAQITREITETEIEGMKHTLTNELFNLYDNYEVRISLLDVARKSEATAQLNLNISQEKYRSGAINSFNFRDVQLIYLEASLRKLQAIYNLIDSHTQLTRITGGYIEQK